MNFSLTSPHMKGKFVEQLQRALKSKGYLQGNVDGEFGPDTARAVYRAKYWFGYKKPDQVAGDLLYSLLLGTKKPNPAMKLRIANRNRIAKQKPIRSKMWEEAGKWIGETEHPAGSNRSKFSLWYGLIGPWCAEFVSWCGVVAKSKAFEKGHKYAYVPYIVADARAGRNNLSITYKPQQGDIACFDWNHDGIADHTGLFGNWINTEKTNFKGREGNTGPTDKSNGGMVLDSEVRHKSEVICFVHVGR